MTVTVGQLHRWLGELVNDGAGKAVVRIEEEGLGYAANLADVNTWMDGEPGTLTLLGERDEGRPEPDSTFLPLPGCQFDEGKTVIASTWINDSPEEPGQRPSALLLLLGGHAPYYTLLDIELIEDESLAWQINEATRRTHPNINPAVEDYAQSGGDY